VLRALRFPLEALALSLALFLVWGPAAAGSYGNLLEIGLRLTSTGYEYVLQEEWLRRNSLFLIPLLSLVLVTPKINWLRKTAAIAIGVLLLAGLDTLRIGMEIGATGPSALYAVYHSGKIVIPLLVWLLAALPVLEAGWQEPAADQGLTLCPLCGVGQEEILQHLREAHDSKCLRYKKVRKFLARHPQSAP
jgi:hypothetical protein